MSPEEAIAAVKAVVRQDSNRVPRPYQTVGGMWTVDTWRIGDVSYQLQDEGYTDVICAPGLRCSQTYVHPVQFQEGSAADLIALAAKLTTPATAVTQ